MNTNIFNKLKLTVTAVIIFFFPLFFLPITQNFFVTSKLYLLAFGALLLLGLSLVEFIFSRKIKWQKTAFDGPLMLFVVAVAFSVVITSTNKIQALLDPNLGLAVIFSLLVVYYYLVKAKDSLPIFKILASSTSILAIITITNFFQPLKNAHLPSAWQFLKNPFFTPAGNLISLALLLGFISVWQITNLANKKKTESEIRNLSHHIFAVVGLALNLVGLLLTLYVIIHPQTLVKNAPSTIVITPWRLSWYAAVEILKNPLNGLFGTGIDGFGTIFTRVKDFTYNQSTLWQINSFPVSRSALLHILTVGGLFSLIAFLLAFLKGKQILANKELAKTNLNINKAILAYLVLIVLIAPPSLVLFFIVFFGLAQINDSSRDDQYALDLIKVLPVYGGIVLISFVFIIGSGYFLSRSYLSEYIFNRAINNLQQKKLKDGYQDMKQAIILNPYQEKYRLNFSQLNLAIANNLISKKKKKITNQDKQNISQAVQTAIAEAKAAVSLNPNKAANWASLADLYRQILGLAKGADGWSVSAFQRAIVLDPQNPIYRMNLGGLLYSLKNYSQARQVFGQTISLKPNWPNAHYNLAWTDYRQKNYQQAAAEMQNTLSLLDARKNKADYDKAKKDLEEFKKMLPKKQAVSSKSAVEKTQPTKLKLPSPPPTKLKEKINLPKEASPGAR